MPVDLDGTGDVAAVVEQHVLVRLDDHQAGVAQVLGQPLGRDQALGVGVLRRAWRRCRWAGSRRGLRGGCRRVDGCPGDPGRVTSQPMLEPQVGCPACGQRGRSVGRSSSTASMASASAAVLSGAVADDPGEAQRHAGRVARARSARRRGRSRRPARAAPGPPSRRSARRRRAEQPLGLPGQHLVGQALERLAEHDEAAGRAEPALPGPGRPGAGWTACRRAGRGPTPRRAPPGRACAPA